MSWMVVSRRFAEDVYRFSPDELESPYTYSPKRDIWHVGLVLLQMLFGMEVLGRFPTVKTVLEPGRFPLIDLELTTSTQLVGVHA